MRRTLIAIAALCVIAAPALAGTERPLFDVRYARGAVKSIAFHPDGKLLASIGNDGGVSLWNLETHRLERTFGPHSRTVDPRIAANQVQRRVEAFAFSPDGKYLAEVAIEPSRAVALRLYNVSDGTEAKILSSDIRNPRALAYSPDSTRIAVNSSDSALSGHAVQIWNVASGKMERDLRREHAAAVLCRFTPDGKKLVTGGGTRIQIWDLESGGMLHTITVHKKTLQSFTISPDGEKVATVGADDTVKIWNIADAKLDREIETKQDGARDVLFTKTGKGVLTAGGDNTIKMWNVRTGKMVRDYWAHIDKVEALALSPDGSMFASAGRDGNIFFWKAEDPPAPKEGEEEEGEKD